MEFLLIIVKNGRGSPPFDFLWGREWDVMLAVAEEWAKKSGRRILLDW